MTTRFGVGLTDAGCGARSGSPSSDSLVSPTVAVGFGSTWLRSTSDRLPTERARSSFSAWIGVTSKVTALTTFGLVSSRLASCATASTRMRSSTILEIARSLSLGFAPSSCVLTMMST
jgi:hypothetical protein